MRNNNKRLDKIEKKLGVGEKPQTVNIPGMEEMSSDEFKELLKEIDGKSKGLPCEQATD